MSRSPTNTARARARNDGLSRQMKRRMSSTKCPACQRKGAMRKFTIDNYASGWQCRYCGHERVTQIGPAFV